MKNKILVSFLLVLVLLAACGGDKKGPSDKQAKKIIYGMYIRDAEIVAKKQCELSTWMEEDGQTDVWLIGYKFEGSDNPSSLLLTKQDDEWQSYLFGMDTCPE